MTDSEKVARVVVKNISLHEDPEGSGITRYAIRVVGGKFYNTFDQSVYWPLFRAMVSRKVAKIRFVEKTRQGRVFREITHVEKRRRLTHLERVVWGECPVCRARHGEKCSEETVAFKGRERKAHNARINLAPLDVPDDMKEANHEV